MFDCGASAVDARCGSTELDRAHPADISTLLTRGHSNRNDIHLRAVGSTVSRPTGVSWCR